MVKMIPMICPKCGASIEVKDGTSQCFCTYCGTKILIKDDSVKTININKTEYDKTKVETAKYECELEKEKLKQEARAKKNKDEKFYAILTSGLLIIMYILVAILIIADK